MDSHYNHVVLYIYIYADIDLCLADLHFCGKHSDCVYTGEDIILTTSYIVSVQ